MTQIINNKVSQIYKESSKDYCVSVGLNGYTEQHNNLKIKLNKSTKKWLVINPYKIILEEFEFLQDAREWAISTKDFLKRKG